MYEKCQRTKPKIKTSLETLRTTLKDSQVIDKPKETSLKLSIGSKVVFEVKILDLTGIKSHNLAKFMSSLDCPPLVMFIL